MWQWEGTSPSASPPTRCRTAPDEALAHDGEVTACAARLGAVEEELARVARDLAGLATEGGGASGA